MLHDILHQILAYPKRYAHGINTVIKVYLLIKSKKKKKKANLWFDENWAVRH